MRQIYRLVFDTGLIDYVIAETRKAAIEKYHEQTGMPKDVIEKHCRIERLGRECDLA